MKLKAIELSEIAGCNTPNQKCTISTPQGDITNHSNRTNEIQINARVDTFTNYGILSILTTAQQTFDIYQGSIGHFINYGTFANLDKMGLWISESSSGVGSVTNYGIMGSVDTGGNKNITLTLNNLGLMGGKGHHIKVQNGSKIAVQNYMLKITENATTFNSFTRLDTTNPTNNFSHLVIEISSNNGSIIFKDGDSKMILDFGNGFEFGEKYLISKLATDQSGNAALSVDFGRLTTRSDIYTLTQSGEYFIAKLTPQHSAISNISKANIHTMNNFYTISNSMIYPRKSYHSQNLTRKNYRNISNSTLDSANPLKSYESFAYRNESINRRIQRQNKRNYNRKLQNQTQNLKESQRDLQNLNLDSANETNQNNLRDSANPNNPSLRANEYERGNPKDLRAKRSNHPQNQNNPQTQRFSQNLAQTPHNYYFILTPFVNHNHFFESGRYNLRGFDYGFLTAFSTRVAESNSLGAHFIFSYGSLGDSKDKDLSIKSLNLNVGINYKLDLIYDMYLKARGDFYYFSNALDSATIKNIKPNNLGFGASVSYGKDFDFGKGGILGIEAGIDYKALKTNEVSLNLQSYKQSLLNLIYADVGINYNKLFVGGFGINLGTGFKANLAPKLAESILILNSQNLRFTIDNDKYLGYANAGISYVLNTKNFDMEFSVAYYGNYGDRVISNGAGVEWRVRF